MATDGHEYAFNEDEDQRGGHTDNTEWVEVHCTNPTCRGRRNGGKGFTVVVPKNKKEKAECNECFCR